MAQRSGYQGAHFKAQPAQKKRRSKAPLIILVIALLAAAAGGGVWFWRHRPVSVTVDGEQRTVLKRSTIDQLYQSESPNVQPGDYVSVSGNVLEAGKGNPYSAVVNGVDVPFEEMTTRVLWGGENISFGPGGNVLEDYTSEVVDVQPKLEYRVAPGTGEKGVQVQQGTVQYVAQWGKVGQQEIRHGSQTGETANGDVISETKNLVIVATDIHPDNDEKLVALTFDDGPTYYTEPYLGILAENDVHATFSIIGEQIADGAPIVTETAQAGHQIISHTWTHPLLTALEQDQVRQELGDTVASLKECLGTDVMYMRPPYGDIDEQVWLKSGGLMSVSLYWTHDSRDWERPGVNAIVSNCTEYMAPGSVILMHDGGGDRSQDLEALPRVISGWKNAGYRFVTVEELLASDSTISLEAVSAGPMPADAAWPTEVA